MLGGDPLPPKDHEHRHSREKTAHFSCSPLLILRGRLSIRPTDGATGIDIHASRVHICPWRSAARPAAAFAAVWRCRPIAQAHALGRRRLAPSACLCACYTRAQHRACVTCAWRRMHAANAHRSTGCICRLLEAVMSRVHALQQAASARRARSTASRSCFALRTKLDRCL